MNSITWVLEPVDDYEVLNNRHDTGYKYLLSVKRVFVQLLKSFVRRSWVDDIDENKVESINRSFILNDFKGKEADLVYKIRIKDQEVFFYILMELQSTVDYQMPYRLLQYMIEIWRTVLHDTEAKQGHHITKGKEFILPRIVPCVLYSGSRKWDVPLHFKDVLARNEEYDSDLDFRYILIDISDHSPKELLDIGNLMSAVFYMDQKPIDEDIISRLSSLTELLRKLSSSDQELFITWVKNVLMRCMSKEEANGIIINDEEVVKMQYAIEEAIQKIRIKSKQEGIIEGRAEGITKGKNEEKISIAKKLKETGLLSLEQISTITELSIEELNKILK